MIKCVPRLTRLRIVETRNESAREKLAAVAGILEKECARLQNQAAHHRQQAIYYRKSDKLLAMGNLRNMKLKEKMREKTLNSHLSVLGLVEVLNQQQVAQQLASAMHQVAETHKLTALKLPQLDKILDSVNDYLGEVNEVSERLAEPQEEIAGGVSDEDELERELAALMAEDVPEPMSPKDNTAAARAMGDAAAAELEDRDVLGLRTPVGAGVGMEFGAGAGAGAGAGRSREKEKLREKTLGAIMSEDDDDEEVDANEMQSVPLVAVSSDAAGGARSRGIPPIAPPPTRTPMARLTQGSGGSTYRVLEPSRT